MESKNKHTKHNNTEPLLMVVAASSPWVPQVSEGLVDRGADGLCLGLLFQGCLYSILGNVEIAFPSKQKAGLLTVQYNKDNISF